jgi:hypothetical protein
MCMFSTPKAAADSVMPPEYASAKSPTERNAAGAGKRAKDKLRAKASTMMAGSTGTGAVDTTGGKVLLGQ